MIWTQPLQNSSVHLTTIISLTRKQVHYFLCFTIIFTLFKFIVTDLPVLSNLIIQDYYPTAPDGASPHFQLCKISSSSRDGGAWSNSRQLDMLHIHKMSEIARVQFACQMLLMDTMNEQKVRAF